MCLPWRRVRPPGRNHREAFDLHQAALAQLDELRPPDHVVHLHLVVVARADKAADACAAELVGGQLHPPVDTLEHHLLEAFGPLGWVMVELLQSLDGHLQRVVALAPDVPLRSEERRVGKEWSARWSTARVQT